MLMTATDRKRRLNLGCGGRFHPDWINLDRHPQHPSVRGHDVTTGLPFPAGHFDAVYHSHLLEHLPRDQALPLVRECFRVLRPGGILRVAVPDLEQIARLYLESLDGAWAGDAEARRRHAWALLELYDQAVRERPGGEMLTYLAGATGRADLAWHRLGADGAIIRQHLGCAMTPPAPLLGSFWRRWRERLIRWLLGCEYDLLQVARFRRGGEVHLWMYDRHSLRELLSRAGFVDFRLTAAGESRIPGWADDRLDTQPDGSPAKPDSLYAEAIRP
jgi:SAM-dependent methyltransferase